MAEPADPPPPAPEATDPYEFPRATEGLFVQLGGRMHFVGIAFVVLGLALVATGLYHREVASIPAGALLVLIGGWTARAGSQFRSVAWTQGHDLGHLLAALTVLRRLYGVQYWLCLVALVAALVLYTSTALY